MRCSVTVLAIPLFAFGTFAQALDPSQASLYFDFNRSLSDLAKPGRDLTLVNVHWRAPLADPLQRDGRKVLEFTGAGQYAEVRTPGLLHGATAATIGGWFYTRRIGEQDFLTRGIPEVRSLGDRRLTPEEVWVNFTLGTDSHGLFTGTIHGNGSLPFPHVTLNEVSINTWNQLAVVKDADGFQKFYQNGELIRTDQDSAWGGKVRSFVDTASGEPVRLSVPMGGLVGEAWVYGRELTATEIRADFEAKRQKYHPTTLGRRVDLRDMDERRATGLWSRPLTMAQWTKERERLSSAVPLVFGRPPRMKAPLMPEVLGDEDCGAYIRRKISIQVQSGDRMPAYLLIPKKRQGRVPAILCFYGTTAGAGKLTTVGLSGPKPGSPPVKNRDFAVTLVEAGFVAFAADYLRDGERIRPGRRPYETTDFYSEFPEWTIHGKDAWDNSRAIDYLETLDFVDAGKIGMVGHSYGGHSTIFSTVLEPRIKVAVANGPVSDFIHHGMHWGVAPGSASLPTMKPFVLDHTKRPPLTFYELTALIAPRPLLVGQAVGERRPMEEENAAAVLEVYRALGAGDRARYFWYAGDHDFPPEAQREAVRWFRRWFGVAP